MAGFLQRKKGMLMPEKKSSTWRGRQVCDQHEGRRVAGAKSIRGETSAQ